GSRDCARRWLHASPGRASECDQHGALRQTQLQFQARYRADRQHHAFSFRHGSASLAAGQNGSRVYGLYQGQPRQGEHGIGRDGKRNPFDWRNLQDMTGLHILHVPYRGSGPAIIDLIGGQVQVMFDAVPASIDHIRGGRLRALAVTGAARSDVLPDVPTVGEFVPGYEASAWFGVGAPKNTPTEIIDKLNKEI